MTIVNVKEFSFLILTIELPYMRLLIRLFQFFAVVCINKTLLRNVENFSTLDFEKKFKLRTPNKKFSDFKLEIEKEMDAPTRPLPPTPVFGEFSSESDEGRASTGRIGPPFRRPMIFFFENLKIISMVI